MRRASQSLGRLAAAGAVGALVLTGAACSTSSSGSLSSDPSSAAVTTTATTVASPSATSASDPVTTTRPTKKAPRTVYKTVTSSAKGSTVTAAPPPSTKEGSSVVGECPYLAADQVSYITGQHHGDTEIVAAQPFPVCYFYRSDGRPMGSIRVVLAGSAPQAVAAVNQHVPLKKSQPASQPSGWVGGSLATGQQVADGQANSVYAVSKGRYAVIAQENESPSIKARDMVICAILGAKLDKYPEPDYCTGPVG